MSRVRLAIADDHALVRASLERLFLGYPQVDVVGTVCSGSRAIALAEKLKPDVFLLDIVMPGLDGLQAIPRIQEASPSTRVLIISMHDEPEYLQEAISRGASGLISKAASPEDLFRAIEAAARGEVMHVSTLLTKREREVLTLIGQGKTGEEIALHLSISQKTVEHYRQQLMGKLQIHTEAGLVAHARQLAITAS
ncbi:response regulator transcription factor [Candidatus Bipolaricaulota bacterium]|nr:response regulator transcription factor [Candidatus Bipolaricaulota bacterium]HHR85118.1 response regulator transcription factor [Candidatus Acetothermia bacterium]